MTTTMIFDLNNHRLKYIPSTQNISSQFILHDIVDGKECAYNFDGDISTRKIGKICRGDILLRSLGCEIGKKYERHIQLDPPQIQISEIIDGLDTNDIKLF